MLLLRVGFDSSARQQNAAIHISWCKVYVTCRISPHYPSNPTSSTAWKNQNKDIGGGDALLARPQIFFAALISSTTKCWSVGSPFGPNTFSTVDGYMLRCGGQVRPRAARTCKFCHACDTVRS